ncbi:MAG: chemotaxis protein CheW [Zetaproteobacteria bacterium]|nr:chemotaxis protein CheW [Zetaproteobacteria bacterium]
MSSIEPSHIEQLRKDFIAESLELIEGALACIENLEDHPRTEAHAEELFRCLHSIKGNSNLIASNTIAAVAHTLESLLYFRKESSQKPIYNTDTIQALFKTFHWFQDILGRMEQMDLRAPQLDMSACSNAEILYNLQEKINHVLCHTDYLAPSYLMPQDQVLGPRLAKETAPALTSQQRKHKDMNVPQPDNVLLQDKKPANPAENNATTASTPTPSENMAKKEADSKPQLAEQFIKNAKGTPLNSSGNDSLRVPISRLDTIMDLVGELVLCRNQILQYAQVFGEDRFSNVCLELKHVSSQLQDEMMKTRMQPIGNITSKFSRIVRDLSQKLDKKIKFKVEGADTGVDRTVLEAIKDPLTHLIRNCLDHGIETKEERARTSKPEVATVMINSFHEGGMVVVDITDDGRGINPEKVAAIAIKRGVVTQHEIDHMSEQQVIELIFAPGFSTAEQVSDLSGRGVGMDVVLTNIEKLGGMVDVQTQLGEGTTMRLKLPLTLAIVPALITKSAGALFAIPQVMLEELVRVEPGSQGSHQIEYLQGAPVIRLRGKLLPLIHLNQVLETETEINLTEPKDESINIAILKAEDTSFGLIVDFIEDTTDIVVKPMMSFLKKTQLYSGATILGNGSIALTLDIMGLATLAHRESKNGHRSDISGPDLKKEDRHELQPHQEYLWFEIFRNGTYALSLDTVERLEEIELNALSKVGNQVNAVYRGHVLPILSIDEFLGGISIVEAIQKIEERNSSKISIIVSQIDQQDVGLLVNQIRDIISTKKQANSHPNTQKAILGEIIEQEEIISVINPEYLQVASPQKAS